MDNFIKSNKKKLQILVIIFLLIFLGVYYLYIKNKGDLDSNPKSDNIAYIQNSIVHVFGDTISIVNYPDRISIHYPYLLVVKPNDKITHIYNFEQKKKEKDIQLALLDYFNGKNLYNNGKTTFLDELDLKVLCEKGYIKSDTEILCITKISSNYRQNKLISINLSSLKQMDLYTSKNLITDVKVINNKIYMGEVDLYTNKYSVLIDNERVDVPDTISILYEMNNEPFFASLKNTANQNEGYYKIIDKTVVKQSESKIYLYK